METKGIVIIGAILAVLVLGAVSLDISPTGFSVSSPIVKSSSCTETDTYNIRDPETAGSCTDDTGTYIDRCKAFAEVVEYVCADDRCRKLDIICEANHMCKEGACLPYEIKDAVNGGSETPTICEDCPVCDPPAEDEGVVTIAFGGEPDTEMMLWGIIAILVVLVLYLGISHVHIKHKKTKKRK